MKKLVIMPPRPHGIVCETMCKRCPFRPDGSGYAQDHPDLPKIIASVEAGLPFYCHETALNDPRTRVDANGDPAGYQAHYEICRGGHERRMKVWREKVIAMGHEPGELVLEKKAVPPAASPAVTRHELSTLRSVSENMRIAYAGRSKTLASLELRGYIRCWPGEPPTITNAGKLVLAESPPRVLEKPPSRPASPPRKKGRK